MPITRKFKTGRKSSITTAVALAASRPSIGDAVIGVKVTAHEDNDDAVYIGDSSGVTADAADSTDGTPIYPGKSEMFYVAGPDLLFAISGSGNAMKVFWLHQ